MARACLGCGGTDSEVNPTDFVTVCTGCGTVIEEVYVTNEVSFQENNAGQSSAVGTFVAEGTCGVILRRGDGFRHNMQKTLSTAREQIKDLSCQLRTLQNVQDKANQYFSACLKAGKTKGRPRAHFIGACFYAACRVLKQSHQLIDISDALEVDPFAVGRTFQYFTKEFCINLPIVEPELYIARFANSLEFGSESYRVERTALRIVKRMQLDGINTGRLPSGVCGAALIIAARLHNYSRTIPDVIRIVRVHESTVRKRLKEFGCTASSDLTPQELAEEVNTEREDPPAFKAARRREERERIALLEREHNLRTEFSEIQDKIDSALTEMHAKALKRKSCASSRAASPTGRLVEDEAETFRRVLQDTIEDSFKPAMSAACKYGDDDEEMETLGPSAKMLGITDSIEKCLQILPPEETVEESTELDLEGIDDDEIATYILSPEEVAIKEQLWDEEYAEFMVKQAEKKEAKRLEEEQRIKEGKAPRRKPERKKARTHEPMRTAGEALQKLCKEKKMSTKLNYQMLNLFTGNKDGAHAVSDTASITGASTTSTSRRSRKSVSNRSVSSCASSKQSTSSRASRKSRASVLSHTWSEQASRLAKKKPKPKLYPIALLDGLSDMTGTPKYDRETDYCEGDDAIDEDEVVIHDEVDDDIEYLSD